MLVVPSLGDSITVGTPVGAGSVNDHSEQPEPAHKSGWEQPEPARPATPESVWLRTPSQLSDDEFAKLLTPHEKADTATPHLQAWLSGLAVTGGLIAIAAVCIFNWSHFRAMDVTTGADAGGQIVGGNADFVVWGIAAFVVVGAILAFIGIRTNVGAGARNLLIVAGGGLMAITGLSVGLFADPSRHDLLKHYHIGAVGLKYYGDSWGSPASFANFVHLLDACGWLVAACGLAVIVLLFVQRRRVRAAYPENRG